MTTSLREKIVELAQLPPDVVRASAEGFIAQAADWPVTTQIPLVRLAEVVAAMMLEADPHVRRLRVSDAVKLRDGLGG